MIRRPPRSTLLEGRRQRQMCIRDRRHTPFGNKYRPQFYLRTMDCTGEITLPEGVEMVMPGDNVEIEVKLIYKVALNEGLRFAIREGGRTVGSGQITKILDDVQ